MRSTIRYVLGRLAGAAILLVVYSFGIYSLLALAPGDPVRLLLGTLPATPETLEAIRALYNLDDPFLTQYWNWLYNAAHFDLGQSVLTGQGVSSAIAERAGITAQLGALTFAITMIVGIPLGMAAGLKRGRLLDRVVSQAAMISVSAPSFAVGILLIIVFAGQLNWLPAIGGGSGGMDRLAHLILPAAALSTAAIALVVRYTRTAVIEVAGQDYIVAARARGLKPSRILFAYVLRNSLVPVITAAGVVLSFVMVGAVVVEATFALPGLGSLLVTAVQQKDLPVVQGVTLVMAATIFLINLLTDLAYLFVDPRIAVNGDSR
ncbi:ABC transporter permease [Aeromicrobium sp. UC242_57]|uniref:ABC transporter permease n=1 Tax=Aeromicrobium sp. UC242_57 TaxID=3374624 RepID=UPI0037B421FF